MAKLEPEFTARSVKVIGLSVDSVDDHAAWSKDIEETQGHAPNYIEPGRCQALRRVASGCVRRRQGTQGDDQHDRAHGLLHRAGQTN